MIPEIDEELEEESETRIDANFQKFEKRFEKRKMKLLFLDGRTDRIHEALRRFSEEFEVTIVTNVRGCLYEMAKQDFDEVYLENDLSGYDFEDPYSPDAGMGVVRYLQTTGWPANKRRPIFRVHTYNVFAAFLMVKTLQSLDLMAFHQPFNEAG